MNNRRRGHNYERLVRKDTLSLGFTNVVTTRSESRNLDNRKVDLFTPSDPLSEFPLPFYAQCKLSTPKRPLNIHQMFTFEDLPRDKPYVIYHMVAENTGKKFVKKGHYVTMDYDYFNYILKTAYFGQGIYRSG